MDQLAEYSWLNFGYSPLIISGSAGRARWSHFGYFLLITRGSAGRAQLVTLRLLSTHHPWISWQSTAGHTSVTLHSSSVGQLSEHSLSQFGNSSLITRGPAGKVQLVKLRLLSTHHPWVSWSHFGYSSLTTRGSAGRAQLVTL